MRMKKCIALLSILLLLITLFGGCANTSGDSASDPDSSGTGDTADDGAVPDDGDSAPDESGDLYEISWLGRENSPENLQAAIDGNYENYRKHIEIMAQYGFELDASMVSFEVYTSTINSLAASNILPDSYLCYGAIDNNTIVNWIENGQLLKGSEIMACSSGNMAKFFAEDGQLNWARAAATYTDGDWYYVFVTNNPARSIQIQEADGPLRVPTQIHGAYDVMIRQDWLDALSLGMPQTAQEYYEACLAMNQNDTNGNGQNDERIIMGLGTEYQYQGVGQWFGLPYMDFMEDPSSGEVEVGILKEGFADWANYLHQFHANGIIYNNEGGHPWISTGSYLAENNVISWTCMQDVIWSSGRTNTGLDSCNYQPMPILAAVEGVAPRLIAQEATAGEWGIGFNANTCTNEMAAAYVDCMYSQELYLLRYFGIEGKSWEWADNGMDIIDYTQQEGYTKGDIENQYMALGKMENSFSGMHNFFPTPLDANLWAPNAHTYSSYREALDAGEPYAQNGNGYDEARWMALNNWNEESPCHKFLTYIADYGEENINFTSYYTFITLPTLEESEVQNTYATDLKTYLLETATKMVTGEYSIDSLQQHIDYCYDTLGLQEYLDVQQARIDRFMDAMGL